MRKVLMVSKEDKGSQEVLKNPEKSYSFAIMRPGGNDTALVRGVVRDAAIRKEVNDALLNIYGNVEQVGFVDLDPAEPELMMAGGEFCGNATRSTAWLALGGKSGEVNIKVSGVKDRLKAGVKQNGEAFAQMPIYSDVSKVTADGENRIVEMEGITQYINFNVKEIEGLSTEKVKAKAMKLIREKNLDRFPAAGVIYSKKEGDNWRITPIVYVKAVETTYAETACGSGTVALGLVLAQKEGGSIKDVPIVQPTGLPIKVSVDYDRKAFGYAQINGPVEPLGEGRLIQKEGLSYAVEMVNRPKDLESALGGGELSSLYKDIFGKAPYFESYTDEAVRKIFSKYVGDGMLFLAKSGGGEIIGFGAAVPMNTVPDEASAANISVEDIDRTWYMADLGVKDDMRFQGVGKNLVLSRLGRLKDCLVVMRTSVYNIASQSLYRSLGFQVILDASQTVDWKRIRQDIPTKDNRLFMSKRV